MSVKIFGFLMTAAILSGILYGCSVPEKEQQPSTQTEYTNETVYTAAEIKSVVSKQGVLKDTPVLIQDGRYLATGKDGRIVFSRSNISSKSALEQDKYLLSENLWVFDTSGSIQKIDLPDFYSLDSAGFSPGGNFLGILDISIENRVLYVYDFSTGRLINLGEEGLGGQTAAFAWSDQSDALYAISGDERLQIMLCTFQSGGTVKIDAAGDITGSEGKLAVSQGRLFFSVNNGDNEKIYEYGTSSREITDGMDFLVSPDGKTILALEAVSSEGEEVLTSLKLCDIQTGESTYIVKNADISLFCFSGSGDTVYYTDATPNSDEGEFRYGLYSYDLSGGTLEQVARCVTGDFALSSVPGEIYLICNAGDEDNKLYATYKYDLND